MAKTQTNQRSTGADAEADAKLNEGSQGSTNSTQTYEQKATALKSKINYLTSLPYAINGKPATVSSNTSSPSSSNYYWKSYKNSVEANNLKNRDDVKKFQQEKLSKYGLGKYGADGVWGKDTEDAYQKYLADTQNNNEGGYYVQSLCCLLRCPARTTDERTKRICHGGQ